jgi:hypothetical protein
VLRVDSAETGKPVGTLPYRDGFAAFRIFDRRLIWLDEKTTRHAQDLTVSIDRRLHGISLDGSSAPWTYALELLRMKDLSFLPP